MRHVPPGLSGEFVMRLLRPHPEYPVLLPETRTAQTAKVPLRAVEVGREHLDYNLQPLTVHRLSHYIHAVVDGDCFRVH
jgi:hypothetical protein